MPCDANIDAPERRGGRRRRDCRGPPHLNKTDLPTVTSPWYSDSISRASWRGVGRSERSGPAPYHPSRDRAEQHAGDENWGICLGNNRVRDARENADEDPGCDG